jgi:hypothetical protein
VSDGRANGRGSCAPCLEIGDENDDLNRFDGWIDGLQSRYDDGRHRFSISVMNEYVQSLLDSRNGALVHETRDVARCVREKRSKRTETAQGKSPSIPDALESLDKLRPQPHLLPGLNHDPALVAGVQNLAEKDGEIFKVFEQARQKVLEPTANVPRED